jgi:hypothetical protein
VGIHKRISDSSLRVCSDILAHNFCFLGITIGTRNVFLVPSSCLSHAYWKVSIAKHSVVFSISGVTRKIYQIAHLATNRKGDCGFEIDFFSAAFFFVADACKFLLPYIATMYV